MYRDCPAPEEQVWQRILLGNEIEGDSRRAAGGVSAEPDFAHLPQRQPPGKVRFDTYPENTDVNKTL